MTQPSERADPLSVQDTYLAFMMDHAAGNQPEAFALAGDLHILLSAEGVQTGEAWARIGGALLEEAVPEPVAAAPPAARSRAEPTLHHACMAERLLAMADAPLRWRRAITGVSYAPLGLPGAKFMKLEPGQSAPRHGHGSLEATVVIHGRFSDGHGTYQRGDLVLGVPGLRHKPRGEGDEACICFVAEPPRPFWWPFREGRLT